MAGTSCGDATNVPRVVESARFIGALLCERCFDDDVDRSAPGVESRATLVRVPDRAFDDFSCCVLCEAGPACHDCLPACFEYRACDEAGMTVAVDEVDDSDDVVVDAAWT